MSGRYLEQVGLEDVAATSLVNVWVGQTEEDGSLQQERLALKADGTFDHRVCHTIARDGSASECSGRWTVHKVRRLGADLQAEGDREISFESEQPLISERLVVCGQNPALNGFIGHACRLYPESPATESASAEPAEAPAEEGEEAGSDDGSQQSEEVSEEELRILTESLGLDRDRCLAALLHVSRGGATAGSATARLELAAEELMRQQEEDQELLEAPASSSGAAAPAAAPPGSALESEADERPAEPPAMEQIQALMSCTGCSERQCLAALLKHPNIDAAADLLLSAAAVSEPEASPPEEPAAKRPRTEGGFLTAAENDALREHEGMMGGENLDSL